MMRIKSSGAGEEAEGGDGGVGRGGGRDGKLIKLEKHAGLNTLLMSTTKDSCSVSGVSEACCA